MARLVSPSKMITKSQTSESYQFAVPVWARGLALVMVVLILGTVLRVFVSQSSSGKAGAWLPWLNQPTVTLYFTDPEGLYLVPVSRPISSNEELTRVALQELIKGPQTSTGLSETLPPHTEIKRLDIQNGVVYVDLSETFLTESDIIQAAAAVEKTLTALPQVKQVRLTVEGRSVGDVAGKGLAAAGETTVTLYFVHGDYLVPVDRFLSEEKNSPRQTMEIYLQGTSSDSSLAGLPAGIKLLDFDFNPENGLAKVNLTYTEDIRALAIADPKKIRLLLTSIIVTLTEFPEVQAVMLDFEGHGQLGLGQCRNLLRTPQLRPTILNDERMLGF